MKFRTSALLTLAACFAFALNSCAPVTQLTSSWADPAAANRNFQKVVVVGVTPQTATRHTFEDAFANELQSRGVTAVASYSFGSEGQLDKDAALAKMKEIGADGVLVTRLVDKETVENYYPPTYSSVAAPSAYYGGWYGYYSMGYSYMTSPGYVEQNQVYRLETNLYDVQNDKLAWSGLTSSTLSSGSAPESEIQPFIATLAADMEKHKVLPKKKK